jgi:hypothetical protein
MFIASSLSFGLPIISLFNTTMVSAAMIVASELIFSFTANTFCCAICMAISSGEKCEGYDSSVSATIISNFISAHSNNCQNVVCHYQKYKRKKIIDKIPVSIINLVNPLSLLYSFIVCALNNCESKCTSGLMINRML